MSSSNLLRSLCGLLTKGPRRGAPPRSARPALETLEDRAVPAALVLGADAKLWLESPGWQSSGRTLVDSNVRGFAQGSDGYDYVLGNDGNLWKEQPGWQTSGRTKIDGNVRSFTLGSDGNYYVLCTDGNLWKEPPGWQTSGRTWIDGNVRTFARGGDGYVHVLGNDGNLWKEQPGWQTSGRTLVDGNVRNFALGSDGYDYVLGTNLNLWKEQPGWQTSGRTFVDSNVRSFAVGSDGYVHVLGTNLTLWKELPGQTSNRTWVDGNVRTFTIGSDGYDYVVGSDGNLWKELPGWQNYSRSWVDGNVLGVVAGNDGYFMTLGPRPGASAAYSPVSGTLFNNNTPSYLDVQQGGLADCWLLASLAETAARVPSNVKNMFLYEGSAVDNGTAVDLYSVRFYDSSGAAQYVTVDTELPGGGATYDHPVGGSGAVNGSASPVLWAALAEKAYVEANARGFVTSGNAGSYQYSALNYGDPVWALQAITGKSANDYTINPSDVASAWNAGKLIVLDTGSPVSSYIVGSHAYALVNYNSSGDLPYEVFNPWGTNSNGWVNGTVNGTYGLFWANAAFLSQNFTTQSIGVAAGPGGPQGHQGGAIGFTGPALGGVRNASARLRSATPAAPATVAAAPHESHAASDTRSALDLVFAQASHLRRQAHAADPFGVCPDNGLEN
jgi:hypothetical protein